VLGDPAKRREQRGQIEQHISSAKVLQGRINQVRMQADGRISAAQAAERERVRAWL
jgi:hypothetical protein